MADTITEPTADQQLIDLYNRGMVKAKSLVLATDQLYAVCLIKLNNAVKPTDYPAIGAAINAVTGVMGIDLLMDHKTRAAIPADHELRLIVEANLRIDPLPPVG